MILDKSILLFATLFAATSQAGPDEFSLNERAACNADNALRNLRDKRYSSSASEFCSVWLQSTFTDTLSVTATTSATATSTPETQFVTETISATITNIETTETTAYPTAENTFLKRGEVPYPGWLSATYPPARVSSACSCFVSAPSPVYTITETTTITTQTNTESTTLPVLTNTQRTFVTETLSAMTTVVNVGPEVFCSVSGCAVGEGFTDQYEVGSVRDCKAACTNAPGCQTFQFNDSYELCNIFESLVVDTRSSGCAGWLFYDSKCVV